MLSHLYRIVREFERHHSVAPNLLYLNYTHFEQLKAALPGLEDTRTLLERLKMEVILLEDVAHPTVAWSSIRARVV